MTATIKNSNTPGPAKAGRNKTEPDKRPVAEAERTSGSASPGAPPAPTLPDTVNNAIDDIEKHFGKGSIMVLGKREVQHFETIPSGSPALDRALGIGGYPRGRIVEVYGPESSGKTTLTLHAI